MIRNSLGGSFSLPSPKVLTKLKNISGAAERREDHVTSPAVMENPLYIDTVIAERN